MERFGNLDFNLYLPLGIFRTIENLTMLQVSKIDEVE